jgi:hypothetical protein
LNHLSQQAIKQAIMEFETGRRSTLAKLQLSVQGLAGSLNSAKKVLVASTVLTAAFCGAVFGLTLVANEASKESHVSNGLLTTLDGQVVKTSINKGYTSLAEMSAETIAQSDFVSFSQDGADRYMQILGVQSTASKKVINTIVGAFEVTEEGMTFAGDNTVLEATEADKAARKAQCEFCKNGRNGQCAMCSNGGRAFAVAGRQPMCAVCTNEWGRNFQCQICSNEAGRKNQCKICSNQGRSNMCSMCANQGRNQQCVICHNAESSKGRTAKCYFCSNWEGRNAAQVLRGEDPAAACSGERDGTYLDDVDVSRFSKDGADDGGAAPFDIVQVDFMTGNAISAVVNEDNFEYAANAHIPDIRVCHNADAACYTQFQFF